MGPQLSKQIDELTSTIDEMNRARKNIIERWEKASDAVKDCFNLQIEQCENVDYYKFYHIKESNKYNLYGKKETVKELSEEFRYESSGNISVIDHANFYNNSEKKLHIANDIYSAIDKYLNNVEGIALEYEKEKQELQRAQMEQRIQKIKEQKAKDKGYPNDLKCWNRVGGATSQGHTYVIAQNGQIKEPNDNDLFNPNHRYKYKDWLKEADGTQIYNQILPGDIVFSFSKSYTADPLKFEVRWTPGEIEDISLTPEQIRIASVCIEETFDRYQVETALINDKELSLEEVIQEVVNICEQKREKSVIMDQFTAQLTNAAINGQNKNIATTKQKTTGQEPDDD